MPSLSKPGIINPIQQTTGVLVKKIRVDYLSFHIILATITMTTKQKVLSKDICVRTAEFQPFFAFLFIIQNFSLGFLWKALHNKPNEKFE